MKHFLISTILLVVMNSAIAYELTDLGANVTPKAISNYIDDNLVIVGSSNTHQYPPTAFSWTAKSGFQLIDGTSANVVNAYGLIAGTTITGAFITDGEQYLDCSDYNAHGMNQYGSVAGYKVGTNPYRPRSLPYNPAVFEGNSWFECESWNVFDIARVYRRGRRDGVYADRFILNAINDGGYAVGYKYRYGLVGSTSILINTNASINDSSDITYLSIPAGGKAADINNKNIIVGTTGSNTRTEPEIYRRAYALDYSTNDLSLLPVLEGGMRSSANDINDLNQVVGSSEKLVGATTEDHAFLWADGTIVDLNDWATAGWVLTSATAINDRGDIVGTGYLNGVPHGFLLTNDPITVPSRVN